ncbi:MAG: hypothetical protein MUC89_16685 [Acetobacteraceae bacterium]|jgi:hypothetical protein|nr:hypothetical protein [Acetobacteraceae bacterium]
MNSLFYLAMLVGVGWLMIWAILPPEQRGKGWWPFDMRDDAASGNAAEVTTPTARRGRSESRARDTSQQPAAAGEARTARAETRASATPGSWRERRDRALSSRRGA